MSASQPSNHLGRVVSCQFPGRYNFDSLIVQPPFILHSTGHKNAGSCWCIWAKNRCEMWGHLGSILLMKSQSMGSTMRLNHHPSQIHQQNITVSCFTLTFTFKYLICLAIWEGFPLRQDHVQGCLSPSGWYSLLPGDLHRFRRPFLLLAHPTSDKAVPGKWCSCPERVQNNTQRNWNIKTWKNEKHVETLDQLGLGPQGTRWVHPAKQTTQGYHEKHSPQEMILGCQDLATRINHIQLGTGCVFRE